LVVYIIVLVMRGHTNIKPMKSIKSAVIQSKMPTETRRYGKRSIMSYEGHLSGFTVGSSALEV